LACNLLAQFVDRYWHGGCFAIFALGFGGAISRSAFTACRIAPSRCASASCH
jgi:hypothetical protein